MLINCLNSFLEKHHYKVILVTTQLVLNFYFGYMLPMRFQYHHTNIILIWLRLYQVKMKYFMLIKLIVDVIYELLTVFRLQVWFFMEFYFLLRNSKKIVQILDG